MSAKDIGFEFWRGFSGLTQETPRLKTPTPGPTRLQTELHKTRLVNVKHAFSKDGIVHRALRLHQEEGAAIGRKRRCGFLVT